MLIILVIPAYLTCPSYRAYLSKLQSYYHTYLDCHIYHRLLVMTKEKWYCCWNHCGNEDGARNRHKKKNVQKLTGWKRSPIIPSHLNKKCRFFKSLNDIPMKGNPLQTNSQPTHQPTNPLPPWGISPRCVSWNRCGINIGRPDGPSCIPWRPACCIAIPGTPGTPGRNAWIFCPWVLMFSGGKLGKVFSISKYFLIIVKPGHWSSPKIRLNFANQFSGSHVLCRRLRLNQLVQIGRCQFSQDRMINSLECIWHIIFSWTKEIPKSDINIGGWFEINAAKDKGELKKDNLSTKTREETHHGSAKKIYKSSGEKEWRSISKFFL